MRMLLLSLSLVVLCDAGAGRGEEAAVPAPDGSTLAVRADAISRDAAGNIRALGNVEIRHLGVRIRCKGSATVFSTDELFATLEARGDIEATAAKKTIWGRHLLYDEKQHLISVSGEPRVSEGNTVSTARQRILCYTETGVMKFEPAAEIYIRRGPEAGAKKPGRKKFLGLF